jgi:hypothetical protein
MLGPSLMRELLHRCRLLAIELMAQGWLDVRTF